MNAQILRQRDPVLFEQFRLGGARVDALRYIEQRIQLVILDLEPLLKRSTLWAMGLLFDALDVFFVAGIHFDEVTDVNEQRHTNFNPCVGGCRLQGVGRRIAFDARLGVGDFGFDMGRQVTAQHALLVRMKLQLANQPVLQKFRRIDDMRSIGICSNDSRFMKKKL